MFTEADLLAANPDRTGEFSSTYLDFFQGQTTFNVLGSSTISINHPDASGSTTVQTGTLTVIARNCPGPSCAMTLKDAALKAHDFEVEVTGPTRRSATCASPT